MGVIVINELIGQVAKSIRNNRDSQLIFEMADGKKYKFDGKESMFYQEQDVSESVSIEEIHGDLEDLVGQPLVQAEAEYVTEDATEEDDDGTATWTFFKFATNQDSVTVRWSGTCDGYYSEPIGDGLTRDKKIL